jgi:plasmid stabilization system protein ParE
MEVAMPPRGWSPKRERQFEHIRDGLLERGASPEKADEIAARTVNKERARVGEVLGPSRMSIDDSGSRPSPRRA